MDELDEYRSIRLKKLETLKARGRDPFLVERFDRTHTLKQAHDAFIAWEVAAVPDALPIQASLAGRIIRVHEVGKAMFFELEDQSDSLQVYVRTDDLGAEGFEDAKRFWDIGNFLGVSGFMFRTRRGEVSLHVQQATLLAIALRQIQAGKIDEQGVQHGGLTDVEQRYRMRYVDLNVNHAARETLARRSRMVSSIRRQLDAAGFIEVETPVLQLVAGGASARPFVTRHRKFDLDMKLRISLELPLKRLIVGGLEKVYEIGRVFRNEGIDTRHNPEFTLLELYEAYANLESMMDLVESLFRTAAQDVLSTTALTSHGQTIDLAKPWRRLPLLAGIEEYSGVSPEEFDTVERGRAALERTLVASGEPAERAATLAQAEPNIGGIIEKMLGVCVEPNLIEPTFITDFPIETSPLAKKREDDPRLTRRFEGYIFKKEVANAFSELNDPIDQRERFEAQSRMHPVGDDEPHPMDEDFIRALEYGMPPTGGVGIGMDRMAMVLLGVESIRDVLFFPQLKPE